MGDYQYFLSDRLLMSEQKLMPQCVVFRLELICRLARIVRNHIGCAMLVWVRLKQVAYQTDQTIYQVKHSLFSEYLRHQLKSPAIQMKLA